MCVMVVKFRLYECSNRTCVYEDCTIEGKNVNKHNLCVIFLLFHYNRSYCVDRLMNFMSVCTCTPRVYESTNQTDFERELWLCMSDAHVC